MQSSSEILSCGSPPFFGPPPALKRTARKINGGVVQRVLDHHNVAPQSSEQKAGDSSARKHLFIASYILPPDRQLAVYGLRRGLATAATAHWRKWLSAAPF